MKKSLISLAVVTLGLGGIVGQAYAGTKVAEYGDPLLGNTYNNCTIKSVYGTGGFGYEYREYHVSCPEDAPKGGVDANVGRVYNYNPYNPYQGTSCQYFPPSGFYVSGNSDCSNWRLYKN